MMTVLALLAALMLAGGCGKAEKKSKSVSSQKKGAKTAKDKKGETEEKAPAKKGEAPKKIEPEPEKPEPEAPKGGADSPEDAFNKMREGWKSGKMGDTLAFIVPEERPAWAFILHIGAAMMVGMAEMMGTKKPGMKEEFDKLIKTHKVSEKPTDDQAKLGEVMQDFKKLVAFTADIYKEVELKPFLNDLQAFLDKFSGDESKKGVAKALKDLKVEGDTATGTVVMDKGEEKPAKFVKKDGRWYISIEGMLK
jgi:hypothetical protein